MPLYGQEENSWIFGCEMTVDRDCQGSSDLEEDAASSDDGFSFGGSNNTSKYVTTNKTMTSSGHGHIGSLPSSTSGFGRSVSPPNGNQTLDFSNRECKKQIQVNTYTSPLTDVTGIPRSSNRNGLSNIYGSSTNSSDQQPLRNGPPTDLNEKNLVDLHPHLKGRERSSDIEEWIRQGEPPRKSLPWTVYGRYEPRPKERIRGESYRAGDVQKTRRGKLNKQHRPDTAGTSGTEHRQIDNKQTRASKQASR